MKPSPGRIVIYRTHGGFDVPAIIVSITTGPSGDPLAPGCVELHPFWNRRKADYITDSGVPGPSDERGHWRWPERVA